MSVIRQINGFNTERKKNECKAQTTAVIETSQLGDGKG